MAASITFMLKVTLLFSATLATLAQDLDESREEINKGGEDRAKKDNGSLVLKTLTDKLAKCNDGTAAGYYITRNKLLKGKNKWLIYFEGGGFCATPNDCNKRYKDEKWQMSSNGWPKSKNLDMSMFSSDSNINPFHNYDKVYIPYCTSDIWSGTKDRNTNKGYKFLGSTVVTAVLGDLITKQKINNAKSVIFAGYSTGGVGVMINADRMIQKLKDNYIKANVGFVVISSWFMKEVKVKRNNTRFIHLNMKGITKAKNVWKSSLPKSCTKNNNNSHENCLFGHHIWKWGQLKTRPLMIIDSMYDKPRLNALNIKIRNGTNSADWTIIKNIAEYVKKSFGKHSAVFLSACYDHNLYHKNNKPWNKIVMNGVTLTNYVKCWEEENFGTRTPTKSSASAGHGSGVVCKFKTKPLFSSCKLIICDEFCGKILIGKTKYEYIDLLIKIGVDLNKLAKSDNKDIDDLRRMTRTEFNKWLTSKIQTAG